MIGTKIVKYFLTANKISCFRTFIAVKLLFNGKLEVTKENLSLLANVLSVSVDSIRKHLKMLKSLELIEKGGQNWVHIVGNKRFKIRNASTGNLSYNFTLDELKDLKKFRTLCRTIEFQEAAKAYQNKKSTERVGAVDKMGTTGYTCSIRWISASTKRNFSTIAKHRIRAKQYGFLTYKRTFTVLSCTKRFETKTACQKTNNSILLFHNCEFKTNEQLKCQLRYSEFDSKKYVLGFKDKKHELEAIVIEETPETYFNFALIKRNVNLSKVEKAIYRANYDLFNNAKN